MTDLAGFRDKLEPIQERKDREARIHMRVRDVGTFVTFCQGVILLN